MFALSPVRFAWREGCASVASKVRPACAWRKTAAAVLLHVPELVDSAETAARLAAAKHLLDGYLDKPLIPKTATPRQKVVELPAPPKEQVQFAAASD